jgi:hypothetical protein
VNFTTLRQAEHAAVNVALAALARRIPSYSLAARILITGMAQSSKPCGTIPLAPKPFISGLQRSNGASAVPTLLTLLNHLETYPILSKLLWAVAWTGIIWSRFSMVITLVTEQVLPLP